MKFGKRLQSEAERRWASHYLDYKELKRAIKEDVDAADPTGAAFERTLRQELAKVGCFYSGRERDLEHALEAALQAGKPAQLSELRSEVQDLRKYAVLNYIAVVKITKKRNRHLRLACGQATPSLRAVNILAGEHFFTSLRLATLATRAEIAASEAAATTPGGPAGDQVAEDFTCPICLNLLRSPVVLSCAHRFCWGCLVAHASTVQNAQHAQHDANNLKADGGDLKAAAMTSAVDVPASPSSVVRPAVWETEASDDDDGATVATFGCPCCRKDQLLDLDRLQVDPHLGAFVQRLEAQRASALRLKLKVSTPTATAEEDEVMADAEEAVEEEDAVHVAVKARAQSIPFRASGPLLAEVSTDSDTPPLQAAVEAQETAATEGASPKAAAVAAAQQWPAQRPPRPSHLHHQQQSSPFSMAERPLLPPQRPEHAGRLTVCLDLDGTLVTTFTPKRAPSLPPSMVSYVVGRGGRLNPQGVFVVERPGLGEFLHRLSVFAEVVVFTAGLEDYASPIFDAIEARYGPIVHRLYRPATVQAEVYPCLKDLSRLGRDLGRCVLVDDTPLAFFRQPDHGVPVLPFKGDVDDRLLTEAVAPLLESLANEGDVSRALARRFNMRRWFAAQGLRPEPGTIPRPASVMARAPSAPSLARRQSAAAAQQQQQQQQRAPVALAALHNAPAAAVLAAAPTSQVLLVCDFDKTLTDWDCAERLCDELAPELTSLLSTVETPANFIPVTNTVLAEMHRRGVSRDRIVTSLRGMADEVPQGTKNMLAAAARRGVDVRILSDANSLFISHILTAAKLQAYVTEVITNPAAFTRLEDASSTVGVNAASWLFGRSSAANKRPPTPQYRLVVGPKHDHAALGHHGCPLCPSNLCKGRELDSLLASSAAPKKVVYVGDGANDLCPALCLGPDDVLLARGGHPLAELVTGKEENGRKVEAQVRVWHTHDELAKLVHECAETWNECGERTMRNGGQLHG